MEKKQKKYISKEEALQKMQRFCAYQERAHEEVKQKLIEIGIYGDAIDEIIVALLEENFLNEERFAKAFARGKFNIKKWGKTRIRQELRLKKISDYCIKKAMEEITDEDYWNTLQAVLEKKSNLLGIEDNFTLRQKLFAYAIQKGYETSFINTGLDAFFQKK